MSSSSANTGTFQEGSKDATNGADAMTTTGGASITCCEKKKHLREKECVRVHARVHVRVRVLSPLSVPTDESWFFLVTEQRLSAAVASVSVCRGYCVWTPDSADL